MFKVEVYNYVQHIVYTSHLNLEELEQYHSTITQLDKVTSLQLRLLDDRTILLPKKFLENSVFFFSEIKEGD